MFATPKINFFSKILATLCIVCRTELIVFRFRYLPCLRFVADYKPAIVSIIIATTIQCMQQMLRKHSTAFSRNPASL